MSAISICTKRSLCMHAKLVRPREISDYHIITSPHGGGGPGVGFVEIIRTRLRTDIKAYRPICAAEHLAPFLPGHPLVATGGHQAISAVSAAPFGSASICLISWAYIKMLGGQGLADSSKIALLNANYMAHRLSNYYSLRFKNGNGRVAHELLIDLAEFDKAAGLKVTDFAKRLQVKGPDHTCLNCLTDVSQDYGFHPPTCSWPISTCILIEPTESETLEEIDRCVATFLGPRWFISPPVVDSVMP